MPNYHLGYEKHLPRKGKNAHNGYISKTVICNESEIETDILRDYDGIFESQLIKKNQTQLTGMDEQIVSLYAKGLSNQEIVDMFKQLYNVDESSSLISRVGDSVKKRVLEWQNRPLDAIYPIVYLDCIVVKVHQDGGLSTNPFLWQEVGRRTGQILPYFLIIPPDIRKAIYTTNAVESLNSVIRRVIKKRDVFPVDDSVSKVIWLIMNRFMINFGDRLNDHR